MIKYKNKFFSYGKWALYFIFIIMIMVSAITCKKSPLEPENSVNIILEDATCTDALYRINIYGYSLPVNARVYLDNELINTLTLTTTDTLLELDRLLPAKTYNLYAEIYSNGRVIRSNTMRFETMDTTSRNFTWEIYEFGDFGPSALMDVAIIDENDIWAVGEINIADTSGKGYTTYNAIHWDGKKWELKRVNVNFRGNVIMLPLEGVFALSGNDIWFVGSLPIHGNGNKWFIYDLRTTLDQNISLSRCWGTSSNDMYFVGRNGNIAHWDGKRWRKIESGTDINLVDIYGDNKGEEIYIVGYETDGRHKSILLRLKDKQVEKIWETGGLVYKEPYGTTLTNLYIKDNTLYLCGSKGYFKENIKLGTKPKKITNILPDWVYEFKGTDRNNIFTFTDLAEIIHYNGVNIKKVLKLPQNINFYGGNAKGNLVVGVGSNYQDIFDNPAVIVIGRRR